jgi:hypothetical protein
MQTVNIFETPIFIRPCENNQQVGEYVSSEIIPAYINRQNQQQNDQNGLSNVYSDFFEGAVKADQSLLAKLYTPDIRALMTHVGFKANVDWQIRPYFWYNITEQGGSQDTHCHITGPQSVNFCAIHYVEFDDAEHTAAYFTNPQEQIIRSTQPSEHQDMVPDYFKNLVRAPKITQGDIVFFPPWLKHTVAKQTSHKRRLTIAMNLSIFQGGTHEKS